MISRDGEFLRMNPADYLRTYTIEELERIAYEEIKKLDDKLTIPVDIEEIVENFHDIEIDVHRGLKDNNHTWGMVVRDLDRDKFVILVDDALLDSDHLRKIYRMTIAEEFAHILLHCEAMKKVENIEDFKTLHNHGNWHKHERNAKWLAASILMPYEHILNNSRELYKQIITKVGFANSEAVKKYLANILAEKYEVSVSPMKYRLENWPIEITKKIDEAMKNKLDFLE